jgi:hypothetical protein
VIGINNEDGFCGYCQAAPNYRTVPFVNRDGAHKSSRTAVADIDLVNDMLTASCGKGGKSGKVAINARLKMSSAGSPDRVGPD